MNASKTNQLKRCGHRGCSLNTPCCCACEDRRPMCKSYTVYVDGVGCYKDETNNARFKGYCPACKSQLENVNANPGMKRCICGVVFCDLTTDKCCICLDERPLGEIYYNYLDGIGMCTVGATRWMHYCGRCQERAKPLPPAIEKSDCEKTDEQFATKRRNSTIYVAILPTSASNSTPASTKVNHITLAQQNATVTPEDNPPPYTDIPDYEVIDHVDDHFNEKGLHDRTEPYKPKKKFFGGLFKYFRKD